MQLSRNVTLLIHAFLDQWLPPFVRDSRLLMLPMFKLLFGEKAELFMDFKEKLHFMNHINIQKIYKQVASCSIRRETDLNSKCLQAIQKAVVGRNVLDIACGQGFLARRLSRDHHVTAADILLDSARFAGYPWISLAEVDILRLPFADRAFDTVVCAHTLEHVLDVNKAVAELRRVTAKRLIIVVPKQRPYSYTFDLHLHFFPYAWSLHLALGKSGKRQTSQLVGGDWFYIEDY